MNPRSPDPGPTRSSVAQVANLLCRRLPVGWLRASPGGRGSETRDTADRKSAPRKSPSERVPHRPVLKPVVGLLGSALVGSLGLSSVLSQIAAKAADVPVPPAAPAGSLAFTPSTNGEFTFDTGVLRGTLRAGGKSLGLSSVIHVPTGRRLDRSNGLFSHYRVFSKGVRYGGGAWDWPSTARLLDDGAVEVSWPAATNRSFALKAVYRWNRASILDLQTSVEPQADLSGFEVFLASYFEEAFTNAFALVKASPDNGGQPGLLAARPSFGDWLMFPRGPDVVPLIQDGRWKLEPNPVAWTIMPQLQRPVAVRRDPKSGLTALLSADAADCFAIAMPHQAEGHYSVYLSLFGRNLKAGEPARARARLALGEMTDDEVPRLVH